MACVVPGTAAFVGGSTVGIEEERGDDFIILVVDIEEFYVLMPDLYVVFGCFDGDIKQTFDEGEQSIEDMWEGEVRFEFFGTIAISFFT